MAPSSSSSKKLLIIDPNPKSKINTSPSTAPPNSASSSSTTSAMPPPEKRTRDQPNLSDCHCCGRRINHTNPKDRLQPLDSVWRIVLLCRKCRKNVHSGQTCPYCFRETANSGDLVKCNGCDRKIHEVCVKKYGNCTPWCYLGVGFGEFRVCVDCWVPELLKKSIRVNDKGEGKDLLGKVKDGKCEGKKKAKLVADTKEQALSRAVVAKNVLDLVDKKAGNTSCSGAAEVADDAEMAIKLHRAMNSSPRISRSKSLNSSALDVSNIRDWNGLFYKRSRLRKRHGEGEKLEASANIVENERTNQPVENGSSIDANRLTRQLLPYKRDRKRKIWQLNDHNAMGSGSRSSQLAESNLENTDILETAFCVNGDQSNNRTNVDRFGKELVTYKRTKRKVQLNGPCDNNTVVFKSECSQPDDAKNRTGQLHICEAEAILPNGSRDVERNRYCLKYYRRVMGTKPNSSCMHSDAFLSDSKVSALALSNSGTVHALKSGKLSLPNGTRNWDSDRYSVKYVRKFSSFRNGTRNRDSDRYSVKYVRKVSRLPNWTRSQASDRYSVKYVRRAKRSKSDSNFDSAFLNVNGKSAVGFTMNCSAESSTVSDV